MSINSSLIVLHPDEGKRFKINIKGDVTKLSLEKIKYILKQNTSIAIPFSELLLKFNGVPLLSNEKLPCGNFGIRSGSVLEVEELSHLDQNPNFSSNPNTNNNNNSIYSPQRQQLEKETLDQQADYLRHSPVEPRGRGAPARASHSPANRSTSNPNYTPSNANHHNSTYRTPTRDGYQPNVFDASIKKYNNDIDSVQDAKRQYQQEKEDAENRLKVILEKEKEALEEREKLEKLKKKEEEKKESRKKELEFRRALLRKEEEMIKNLQMLKLENEKKKNMLLLQKQIHQGERERALLEEETLYRTNKRRELQLREREIEAEFNQLAQDRERRELAEDRRCALRQKLHYYNRMGMDPPPQLLAELERDFYPDSTPRPEPSYSHTSHTPRSPQALPPQAQGSPQGQAFRPPPPLSLYRSSPSTPQYHHSNPNNTNNNNNNPVAMTSSSGAPLVVLEDGAYYDARENAVENLLRLGEELQIRSNSNSNGNSMNREEQLCFDENNTCVVNIDNEFTLLLTFDAATERLYVYSTLLTNLPSGNDPNNKRNERLKLKLYEYLLECSLLGREMAGGNIGASMQPNFSSGNHTNTNSTTNHSNGENNFILLSYSIYLPTSQPWTLKTTVPQFVECLRYWRKAVADFILNFEHEDPSTNTTVHENTNTNNTTNSHIDLSAASMMNHSTAQHSADPGQVLTLGLEITDRVQLQDRSTGNNYYVYEDGVLVVSATGPAALAGVLPHDIIKSINEIPLQYKRFLTTANNNNTKVPKFKNNVELFKSIVRETLAPGQDAELLLERQSLPVKVTLKAGTIYQL